MIFLGVAWVGRGMFSFQTDWFNCSLQCLNDRSKRAQHVEEKAAKMTKSNYLHVKSVIDLKLCPSSEVRSPALRSPRSGTPRRHLITPIPGNGSISSLVLLSPFLFPVLTFFLLTPSGMSLILEEDESHEKLNPLSFCLRSLPALLFTVYPSPPQNTRTQMPHLTTSISDFLCQHQSRNLCYISEANRKDVDMPFWPVWHNRYREAFSLFLIQELVKSDHCSLTSAISLVRG